MHALAVYTARRHTEAAALAMALALALCSPALGQDGDAGGVVPLAEAGDAAAGRVAELVSQLQSGDMGARIEAIGELANSTDRRGITALTDACRDADNAVRAAAARALGVAGDRVAAPAVRALMADPDPQVAAAAVRAVGRLNDRDALSVAEGLATSEDPSLRAAVADALPGIAGRDALSLLERLAKDSDSRVRTSVALSLGDLGGAKTHESVLALLADSDPGVCDAAAWAVLKQPQVPLAEVARLATEGAPPCRAAATRVLGRVGHPSTTPVLEKALSDDDATVRKEAAQALGAMGAAGTAEAIALLLGDRAATVRSAGASALASLRPAGVRYLEAALSSDKASTRAAALAGLGQAGGPVELIARHLADPVPECAAAAEKALEGIGGRASAAAARALSSQNDAVAAAAARILAGADPSAVPALNDALRSGRPQLAEAAAEALAGVDTASAGRCLVEAATSDPESARYAIRAAGARRDPELASGLALALRRSTTAEVTAHALGLIGDASAGEPLAEVFRSGGSASGAAAAALARLGSAGRAPLAAGLSSDATRPLALAALASSSTAASVIDADTVASASSVERRLVARALAGGPPGGGIVLGTLLRDTDSRVRLAAARSLRSGAAAAAIEEADLDALRQEAAAGGGVSRQNAAALLGALGDPGSVPLLVSLLWDQAPEVRSASKGALIEIGDRSVAAVANFLGEDDTALVADAAGILEAIGTDSAEKALLAAAASASGDRLVTIATALAANAAPAARFAAGRAATYLVAQAKGGDASAVAALGDLGASGMRALRTLAQEGTPAQQARSLVALRRGLSEDLGTVADAALRTAQDARVLAQAAECAGRSRRPGADQDLAALLGSEDPAVAGAAARALGRLRSDAAVSALGNLLPNADAGPVAARALGFSGVPGHDLLLRALAGDDSVAAANAALGLVLAPSDDAIDGLVQVLAAEDPDLRAAAARALSESDADIVGALSRIAGRVPSTPEEARRRAAAIAVLGRVGTAEAAEAIGELPDAPDTRSRQASALVQMGEAGDEQLQQMLVRGGTDRLWALRQTDRPLPDDAARQALASEDAGTRRAAAAALARASVPSACPRLAAAVDDDDAAVRWAVADALVAAGESASPDLAAVLTSGSDAARAAASEVLGLTGGQAALDALVAALADPSATVAGRSLASLGRIAPKVASEGVSSRLNALGDTPDAETLRALDELRAAGTIARIGAAEELGARPESWSLLSLVDNDPPEVGIAPLAAAAGATPPPMALAALHALRGQRLPLVVSAFETAARNGATEVAGAAVAALEELGGSSAAIAPARDRLLHAAANGSPTERADSLYALRQVGAESVTSALVEGLKDTDPAVRASATAALVARGERSIGRMASALHSPDARERQAAVRALGALAGGSTRDELARLAADDSDAAQADAVWALQRMTPDASPPTAVVDFARSVLARDDVGAGSLAAIGPAAASALAEALASPDARTRARAATLVGRAGAAELAGRVAAVLETDASPAVRLHAARALDRLAGAAGGDALLSALADPDVGVAAAAANALGRLGGDAVSALAAERLAASSETAAVAGPALARLGQLSLIGEPAKARSVPVRVAAALGLGASPNADEAVGTLAALLGDPEPIVRLAASRALSAIGLDALPPLHSAVGSQAPSQATAAVAAVGGIPGDGARRLLVEAAERPEQRVDAVAALVRRGVGAEAVVSDLLKSPDAAARRAAAVALASASDERAASAIPAALQDADPWVVRAAIQAGGAPGLSAVVPQLLPLLSRDDTRSAVAYLLSKQGTLAPILADALADPDLVAPAATVLGELGTGEAVASLLPLLKGDDATLADRAAMALARADDGEAREATRAYGDILCVRLAEATPANRPRIAHTLLMVSPEAAAAHVAAADEDVAAHLLGILSQRRWTGDARGVRRWLESDQPRLQHLAAQALANGPSAPDVMVPLLRHPNPKVSAAAARALVSTGDAASLEAVTQRAQEVLGELSNRDPLVRESAVAVLTAMGGIGVAAATPRLAAGGVAPTSAMRVLAQAGGSEAVSGIVGLLAEGSPSTRAEAAWSLGQFGSAKAAEALVRALGDPQSDVVLAAAEGLGARADFRGAQPAVESAALGLEKRVRSCSGESCRRLTRALALLGRSGSAALVRLAMDDAVRLDIRRAALLAIRLEDPDHVRRVAALLADDRLGPAAAEALANASEASGAAITLEPALGSHNPQVVLAAARAAGRLGDPGLRPGLSAALRRAGETEAGALAWALAHTGPGAEDALIALLKSVPSRDAKEAVVAALGLIGGPPVVDALTRALSDPDIRHQAIQTLGRIPSTDAIEVLIGLLGAEDEVSSQTAAGSLARSGDAVVPRLHLVACSGTSTERYWAVVALSQIGSAASRGALADIAGRHDPATDWLIRDIMGPQS